MNAPSALQDRHIIFVPGMKPKPPPDIHLRELWRVFVAGIARRDEPLAAELTRHPQLFELVSWTYSFYARYRDIELDLPGIEHGLESAEPDAKDIREIESLNRRVRRWVHVVGDAFPFMTRWLAKPDVRLTMGEARRYLNDRDGIATTIRDQVAAALTTAWDRGRRVALIGHSLGSVIAYDTLWQLCREHGDDRRIELFVTLGSPLATRFIRRHLKGARRSGVERFPCNIQRWENFSARGEMTAIHPALRPAFADMVEMGLTDAIVDHTGFYNFFRGDVGLNVHKSYGYLLAQPFAETLAAWLGGTLEQPTTG